MPEHEEYLQKTLTYKVHVYPDAFFVTDPWGQSSSRKSLDKLDQTVRSFESMRFDYEIVEHGEYDSGLSWPVE